MVRVREARKAFRSGGDARDRQGSCRVAGRSWCGGAFGGAVRGNADSRVRNDGESYLWFTSFVPIILLARSGSIAMDLRHPESLS